MEFTLSTELPKSPDTIWPVLLDFRRVAACIPGCEQVEELGVLSHYKALMKQKVGPFRLEVPSEVFVDEVVPSERVRAHATGRDKFTGTGFTVNFTVELGPSGEAQSRLTVSAGLQVNGRLAMLGYAVIRKKAEENFSAFNERLKVEVMA